MARRKKVSVEELESILTGVAHEIRNPLNALNMNTQLLAEYAGMLPHWFPKKKEMEEIIASNNEVLSRLNDLVSEFLRFSRPPKPEFIMADLNDLVSEVISFIEADFSGKGIRMRFLPATAPLPVLIDGKMVKQALLNVLLNAADALDKVDKLINISTGEKGGRYFVSVKDNGSGISREERKKIFNMFHTTKEHGSGLGLPIVKKVMREHHGSVKLLSRKGKGSEFVLSFIPAEIFRREIEKRSRGELLPEVVR